MFIKTDEFIVPGSKKAVLFYGPYNVPVKKLWYPIRSLKRAGYSVVTFEYPSTIFSGGDPQDLITAVEETKQHARKKVDELKSQGYTDFGFFGSSLGAFMAYSCFKSVPEFGWGVLNGGGEVAEAMWNFPTERGYFEPKGYTKETLSEAWRDVQYPDLGDQAGKYFILISSHGDTLTTVEKAMRTFDLIKNSGPDIELILHKKLNHVPTVALNLIRARKHVKKAHNKSMVR